MAGPILQMRKLRAMDGHVQWLPRAGLPVSGGLGAKIRQLTLGPPLSTGCPRLPQWEFAAHVWSVLFLT